MANIIHKRFIIVITTTAISITIKPEWRFKITTESFNGVHYLSAVTNKKGTDVVNLKHLMWSYETLLHSYDHLLIK